MNMRTVAITAACSILTVFSASTTEIEEPDLPVSEVSASQREVSLGTQNGPESVPEVIKEESIVEWEKFTITAYSSRPEETDNDPCISADNSNICDLIQQGKVVCASNDYPFGTKLILLLRDPVVCEVRDRMNRRYTGKHRIDLYFGMDTPAAKQFGVQKSVRVREDIIIE